jgi:3-deoxy-D-manno-octulosonic-acid transferase
MKALFWFLYRCGTWLFFGGLRLVAGLGHAQARARRRGLRHPPLVFHQRKPGQPLVWFHCASAGELEQALPVMEILKRRRPDVYLLVSVFSPSGWDFARRRQYTCIDALAFLPDDVPGAALRWLRFWDPQVAVFVKYEFWWGFLKALHRSGLPVFLISAYFSSRHRRLRGLYRQILPLFTKIFVQNASAQNFCMSLGIGAEVAGDTRVDRVVAIRQQKEGMLTSYRNEIPTVILGSLWPQDLEVLAPVMLKRLKDWRWILCPHKPQGMTDLFLRRLHAGHPRLWSKAATMLQEAGAGLHILQEMGVLSWLYGVGRWAYVGGGFGRGIHNTLEAAVWGLPVLCGPHIRRFAEALELKERGVLHVVRDSAEAERFIESLTPAFYDTAKLQAQSFFADHRGASERIWTSLKDFLPPVQ